MTIARVIGIALALLLFFDGHSFGRPAAQVAATKATEIFQGDIVELKIPGVGVTAAEGRMGKTTIPFFSNGSGFYTALVGADIDQAGLSSSHGQMYDVDGDAARQPNFIADQTKVLQERIVFGCRRPDQLSPEVLERIRRTKTNFPALS
jgi:hypothetical protein